MLKQMSGNQNSMQRFDCTKTCIGFDFNNLN